MVAGGAGLLLGLHPDWGPVELKTALMITARREATFEADPARVYRQGNGIFDFARAAELEYLPSTAGIFVPVIARKPAQSWIWEYRFEVHNRSNTARQFQAEVESRASLTGATVTVQPASRRIGSGQRGEFTLQVRFTPSLVTGSFEGSIRLTPSQGPAATVSYFGAAAIPRGETLQVARSASTTVRLPTTPARVSSWRRATPVLPIRSWTATTPAT